MADTERATPDASLRAPVLLLAMPQVLDPFFHKSVVLLVHQEGEGSLGFIVNRPTNVSVDEVLDGLDLDWQGTDELLAYFGGPVEPQLGTVIFDTASGTVTPDADGEVTTNEIVPGVGMTQHIGDLTELAASPPSSLRLFLGYAGWGEGQLEQEILRNDWMTAPVTDELLFSEDPQTTWQRAFASIGIDPDALPQWTQQTDDPEGAN